MPSYRVEWAANHFTVIEEDASEAKEIDVADERWILADVRRKENAESRRSPGLH